MDNSDKVTLVQTLLGNDSEATNALVTVYLTLAERRILERLYPFGIPEEAELPTDYDYTQCELAQRMFLRRGGEGEIAHSENGISRNYGSVNDEDIMSRIVPFAVVV